MPSVDTNVLLRLLLGDVPEQRERLLQKLSSYKTVAIADLAITEMVYVLEKVLTVPRSSIADLLAALLANQHLNFNRPLVEHVTPYYVAHPAVSFNDCCLAVYAQLTGAQPLYTFDKKLANQIPGAELL
jgi:predicted nucleic-acid-binding protein